MTYVFNIFVFLQLFNQVNCRKDGVREYNVFSKLGHNAYFLLVLLGEFGLQFLWTAGLPGLTRTHSLTNKEWGACLVLGATPLLAAALLKCTPERWVARFKVKIVDESTELSQKSGVLKAFG